MPASYVHQRIALDVYEQLNKPDSIHLPAYLAGAEGPDIFFFTLLASKKHTRPSEVGHLAHTTRVNDFLNALKKYADDHMEHAVLSSYYLGFLTHYAADTICHPFIHARAFDGEGRYSSFMHSSFEHKLETYFYRLRENSTGLPLHMRGFNELGPKERDAIAAMLYEAVRDTFSDVDLPYREIRNGIDQAAVFGRLLKSEGEKKNSLLFKIAYKTPIGTLARSHTMPLEIEEDDLTNRAHEVWHSPWQPDADRRESFEELYEAAVTRAEELVTAALDGHISDELLGDMSYDSGIRWTESEDMTK